VVDQQYAAARGDRARVSDRAMPGMNRWLENIEQAATEGHYQRASALAAEFQFAFEVVGRRQHDDGVWHAAAIAGSQERNYLEGESRQADRAVRVGKKPIGMATPGAMNEDARNHFGRSGAMTPTPGTAVPLMRAASRM